MICSQKLICKGWFLPPNTYDCGSFVVNRKAVVGKEQKKSYNRYKFSTDWKVLYTNLTVNGTLFEHLAEIDRSCNDRIESIVSAMAREEDVTETLKAADQME